MIISNCFVGIGLFMVSDFFHNLVILTEEGSHQVAPQRLDKKYKGENVVVAGTNL